MTEPSPRATNIAGPDGIVHRAIANKTRQLYMRACSWGSTIGEITPIVAQADLTRAPVNCIACLGST